MNPELLRNLWLEAQPARLLLIAGLILLVLAATLLAPFGVSSTDAAALLLYWFFVVLWGTRNAALSVVGEIRERTWDIQILSSVRPFDMVSGKLLGSTSANWFAGLICLPIILAPMWKSDGAAASLTYGIILISLGLFAQAVSFLASLVLIRRHTGNWRLDTFLCQVAGIVAAFAYYSLWSSVSAFESSGLETISWWGWEFNLSAFHLASLLVFLAWVLVGCWRLMRQELRFSNGPFVWLGYLLYLVLYNAGFESWISTHIGVLFSDWTHPALQDAMMRLGLAFFVLLASCYTMVFLEPKDPIRLRWLIEQFWSGRATKAFLNLDCWMLSFGATLIAGVILAIILSFDRANVQGFALSSLTPSLFAILGFLARDVGIFVVMGLLTQTRGDFAALGILALLYLILPVALREANLGSLNLLLLPASKSWFGAALAWAEAAALWLIAMQKLKPSLNTR